MSINTRLLAVKRHGNRLLAILGGDYGPQIERRIVDQVIVEQGTRPVDDLYFALKPLSRNRGEVDYRAFTALEPQRINHNPESAFTLYRIGDAVASRNIHAAIYDALRLCLAV